MLPSPLLMTSQSEYDPATTAYLNEMVTPLDTNRADAINDYVISLKAAGLFTLPAYIGIHALVTEQQSLLNLLNPTDVDIGTLDKIGSPVFTTKAGIASNGNNANRYQTSINYTNAKLKFGQNSACFGAWFDPAPSQNAVNMGTSDNLNWMVPNYLGSHQYGRVNMSSNSSISAGGGGVGLHMMNRSASNAFQMYFNGSNFSSGSTASAARTNVPFCFGNANGSSPGSSRLRVSLVGPSMTDGQHADFYAATNNLLTALDAIP
jgi:hypothetical protein